MVRSNYELDQEYRKLSCAQKKAKHTIAQFRLKKLAILLKHILEHCENWVVNDTFYKTSLIEAYDIINPPKRALNS